MATSTAVLRSFAAGELSPALASRADLALYHAGLRRCRNFLIARHGGVQNRPGTLFVASCKTTSVDVRLVRYVSEVPDESVLIELGNGYLRFFQNGAPVVVDHDDVDAYDSGDPYAPGDLVEDGGVIYYCHTAAAPAEAPPDTDFWYPLPASGADSLYEIPSPFTAPRETKWVQSGRVITFTHQAVRPRDLTFEAITRWIFTPVTTVSPVAAPANLAVVQAADESAITYAVRGVIGADAGPLSAEFTDDFGPPSFERPISLTWDAPSPSGADYYEVYKGTPGALYLLGTTETTAFDDVGQAVGIPWAPGTGGGIVDEPTNLDATQGAATPLLSEFRYIVTAVIGDEESFASDAAIEDLEAPSVSRPHNLSWDAVAGAESYRIYHDADLDGTYGRVDAGVVGAAYSYTGTPAPDEAVTPPVDSNFFSGDEFPAVAGYFQQRRFFANRASEPDVVKASRVGQPNNFTVSDPLTDADAISFRLRGAQQHAVRALVGATGGLFVMTDGGEWRALTGPNDPLTPSNLPFDQETYVGMHDQVRPVVVGGRVVYVQARGRKVCEIAFRQPVEGAPGSLAGRDLTPFASHLFDGFTLTALDYQYEPHSIVWACRNDGALLGLTYLPELDTFGWHRHDTKGGLGVFEDVCVVPEANADTVYTIVQRSVDGGTVRYIERLASRQQALVFADSAVVYSGVAIATLTGLDHLEGETVVVFADGAPRTSQVVASGQIALGGSYTEVVAGLEIEADLETLDLDEGASGIRDKKKRVQSIGLLLDASARRFASGPDADHLTAYSAPSYDGAAAAFSGFVELSLISTFGYTGRVFVRHTTPTPLTILGLLPRVEVGG